MQPRSVSSRITGAIAVAILALAVTACGGSDESSSSSTTAPSTTTAESTTTTAAGGTTGAVDCTAVQTALTSVSQIEQQATSEGSSFNLEQFESDLPQLREQAGVIEQQAQAAGAPAEAVQLYTERNNAVIGLLEQLAQTENQQEFQTQYAAYQTPEYSTAAETVGAALKAECPTLSD